MSVEQSKLQQTPQRNKDLAFRYVRECEEKNKRKISIPEMVTYLCLTYVNQIEDNLQIIHVNLQKLMVIV